MEKLTSFKDLSAPSDNVCIADASVLYLKNTVTFSLS